MLIVTAVNVTSDESGKRTPVRTDGTSDYICEVAINHNPPIWAGAISNHVRKRGAGALLRLIADKIDGEGKL